MIEAQKFSKNFASEIKKTYPNLPPNSIILYSLAEKESRQSLQFSNAIQAVYDDASLTIYYNKSDLTRDIHQGMKRPVYIYPQ